MKNKRRKETILVKKIIKDFNKQLKEDCFAGRFEVKKINQKDFQEPAYTTYYPKTMTIEDADDPTYRHSLYKIQIIDNEEQKRNMMYWAKYSKYFGLHDFIPIYDECGDPNNCETYTGPGGIATLGLVLNNFIVKSDFWEKWKNPEYIKKHWYSGKELERQIKMNEHMKTPEEYMATYSHKFIEEHA